MEKIKGLFRSRKFWAAVVALLMLFVKTLVPEFPLSEDQVASMVYVLMAYILGVALEDGLTAVGGGRQLEDGRVISVQDDKHG